MTPRHHLTCAILALLLSSTVVTSGGGGLTVEWEKDYLTIHGDIPGGPVPIHYLEAYVRPNSTTTDWVKHSKIPHATQLISASPDHKTLKLRCTVDGGVTVDHVITARDDEVDFRLTATNPTDKPSDVHWAQPCIRVGDFTGLGKEQTRDAYAYVNKCFIFLDGKLERMPTKHWEMQARYVPGQVWCPANISRDDVNPRPLSPDVPSNGLIGCFSGDDKMVFATAWEPYQELFQGVGRCIHSDFRVGGLKPGETRTIRGKIYIVPADIPALLKRYQADFPEHVSAK